MGNFSSQETTETISSFTNLVNSVSNTVVNNSGIRCGNAQSITIQVGSAPGMSERFNEYCASITRLTGSTFNSVQTNTTSCVLNATNITQISNTLKNDLKTSINQWITDNLTQNGGWLQTALNIANQEQVSQDDLVNNLTNLISDNVSNTCSAYVNSDQNITYSFCGVYDNFVLDTNQSSAGLSIANCLNKTIVQSYESNSVLIDIVQKTDAAVAQTGAGIFDWLTTIIVVIVIVGLISAIAYYYFQGNQNQPKPQEFYVRPGGYRQVPV